MVDHMDYKDCLIDGSITVVEAMHKIEQLGTRVLFVVDGEGVLTGALSDSDIRNWILKTGSTEGTAENAANDAPKVVLAGQEDLAQELADRYHIDVIPVVNEKRQVQNVLFLYNTISRFTERLDTPILMMAGGKGKRLYPYTKILPKPLIPIRDIPISQRIFDHFYDCGCRDFYMVVNYKKEMIKAYYQDVSLGYKITFLDEQIPLGTGGGVRLAREHISDTFILANCDSMLNIDYSKAVQHHKQEKNVVTIICSMVKYTIPYGVVDFKENGKVTGMREKPSYSFFTNTGIYIVEPAVFDHIRDNEEIDFPSVIERCREKGLNVGAYPISEDAWMDMGQFSTMEDMERRLLQSKTE